MRNIIYLGKLLLANKVTKFLFLLHPLLILVIILSTAITAIGSLRKQNFKGLVIYFYACTILCHVFFLICTCLVFKLAILFQFVSNITRSFMQPTSAKLAEDGITAYALPANSTWNFAFYGNLSSIFTTNHHFDFLNTYSPPF